MNTIIEYFNHFWGYVELAGTIASAICVYLAIKQNIWTWFWGAIGVAFFGPMFYHYQLYSDAGLNVLFFLPMQLLGYLWWTKQLPDWLTGLSNTISKIFPVPDGELKVTTLTRSAVLKLFTALVTITLVNGYLMATYTDASFAYADALTTWMSIFAQILMLKKFLESWVVWVTMDAIAIYIYFAKGLVVVSGLYAVFFVLATMGGIAWYKSWKANEQTA